MKRLALIPLVVALVGVFALVACGADEPEEVAKPAPAALAAPAPTALPAVVAPAPKVEPVAVGKTGLAGVVATPAPAAKAMEPAKVEDDRFGGVLKIILAGSLGSVDSTASGSANTRGIAWHVVETLLGWDDAGIIRGDMVDTWKIENDGTKFTFTLRDGLNWHDGTAVDSDDIVASLERWRAFDRRLAPFVNEVWDSSQVIDEKTFQVNLTGPTGILMMGLGFPGGNQANMWPKELIEAHPFGGDPLDSNLNGSGPYKFTTWRPGYQVILDKNYDYVSDTDPPEYRVGAKIGYYDQLDFIEVPEQQTRVAAILTGEVDFLDAISGDFFDKAMDNTDKVKIHVGKPGAMPWITLGPKDEEYDEKSGDGLFYLFSEKGKNMRLAIGAALNAEEVMKAYGPPNMWGLCASYWHCGTFWGEGDFSGGRYNWNDPEESRSLQQLAGYNNEVIHLYDPAGYATITMIPNVIFPQLTAAGLNIEYHVTSWAAMGKLRDSVAGNWISPTWQSSTVYHPLMSGVFTPKAYPDPELQALRTKLASTVDQAAAKKISEDMQRIMWDNPPGWYFGQFFQLRVYNKDIQDVEVRGAPVGSIMTLNQWWGDLSKRAQ